MGDSQEAKVILKKSSLAIGNLQGLKTGARNHSNASERATL